MKKFYLTSFLVFLCALPQNLSAWSRCGHDAIAYIAEQNLTPATKQIVEGYIGGKSIVYFASWPDQIRFNHEYALTYKDFKHTCYYTADLRASGRDGKIDGLSQIHAYMQSLSGGKYREMPDSSVAVAIQALVHIVGDVHCPVHQHVEGRVENLSLIWEGQKVRFHTFWDSMPEKVHRWSYMEFAHQLNRFTPEQIANATSGDVFDWGEQNVRETIAVWDYVENGGELGKPYLNKVAPILDAMIAKAGYRLAYVLNSIFDPEGVQHTAFEGLKEPKVYKDDLSVISFDMCRYDKDATENKWEDRLPAIVAMVSAESPAVMGVQYVEYRQKDDLDRNLPQYASFGGGAYDGKKKGLLNPVYYRTDLLKLEKSGMFWYSDTPDKPKTSFECAKKCCCATWGVFTVISSGKRFILLNTCLDSKSEENRALQAPMILRMLDKYGNGLPAVVTANLNSNQAGTFGTDMNIPAVVLSTRMIDGRRLSYCTSDVKSYNAYGKKKAKTVDFIFYTPEFEGLRFKTLNSKYENVEYISNHYPIRNVLRLK